MIRRVYAQFHETNEPTKRPYISFVPPTPEREFNLKVEGYICYEFDVDFLGVAETNPDRILDGVTARPGKPGCMGCDQGYVKDKSSP